MDSSKILEVVLSVISLVLTGVVIPWINTKCDEAKMDKIRKYATIAVQCAEQLYPDDGNGALKKSYVVGYLNNIGLKVSEDTLDTIIESCVYDLKQLQSL